MLKGHTKNIPLTNIFQTLNMNQQGGILSVKLQKQERHLAIGPAGVSFVTERAYESKVLEQVLTRLRIVSESEYRNVFSTSASSTPPGDLLLSRHVIRPDQVTHEIREQFLEFLYEIFSWPDASYQFDVQDLGRERLVFADPEVAPALIFPVNSVLMDVARREDEWSRIHEVISGPDQIYRITGDENTLAEFEAVETSQDRAENLIQLLRSGELTVNEIIEQTDMPAFQAYATLRGLAVAGVIAPLDLDDKKKLAERLRQQFQMPRMASVYQSILAESPLESDIRKKLLIFLERKKTPPEELIPHLRQLAEDAHTQGDLANARQYYERILSTEPHDLAALEGSTQIDLVQSKDRDINRPVSAYLATIRNRREYERGAEFLLQLADQHPRSGQLLHEAAHLYLLAGKPQEAETHYEAAAKVYLTKKNLNALTKVVEKLESFSERAAARWRKHLGNQQRSLPKQRKRVVLHLTLGVLILAFVCVGAFATYEWDARVSYAEALESAREQARQGNLIGARQILDEFEERHAYSLVAQGIGEVDVNELRVSQEPDAGFGQENPQEPYPDQIPNDTDSAPQSGFDASKYVTRGTVLQNQGDYAGALEHYRSVPMDQLPMALSSSIEKQCAELERYLSAAQEIYDEARAAEEASDLDTASLAFRRLLKEYPNSSAAKSVKLPMAIDVLPPDSNVKLNGRLLEGPPYKLQLTPDEQPVVTVERPGFFSDSLVLDPLRSPRARIQLQRETAWIEKLPAPVEADPYVDGGRVFVGTRSGTVFALSLANGNEAWQYALDGIGDVLGAIHGFEDDIVFTGTDRAIYRVKQNNGSQVFRLPFPSGVGLSRTPMTPPDSAGRTFLVTSQGKVLGIDLQTPKILWTYSIGGSGVRAPVVHDSLVFVASHEGRLSCLDAQSGEQLWSQRIPDPITTVPGVNQNLLVIGTDRGELRAFTHTGEEKWTIPLGVTPQGAVLCFDGKYAVASQTGTLTAGRMDDGSVEWQVEGLGHDLQAPRAYGENLAVLTGEGNLLVHDQTTGRMLWGYQMGSAPGCPLVASQGDLILSSMDRRIHVLEEH